MGRIEVTPKAQRIAIAEARGWKRDIANQHLWRHPTTKALFQTEDIPDYLSDLNAMHEAEKVLTVDQKFDYNDILDDLEPDKWVWERTATQRAEALLKTLNLWDK